MSDHRIEKVGEDEWRLEGIPLIVATIKRTRPAKGVTHKITSRVALAGVKLSRNTDGVYVICDTQAYLATGDFEEVLNGVIERVLVDAARILARHANDTLADLARVGMLQLDRGQSVDDGFWLELRAKLDRSIKAAEKV